MGSSYHGGKWRYLVANVSSQSPRVHSVGNSIITILECEFTYIPPLKKFIDTLKRLITVANGDSQREVGCRMALGSTQSWGSVLRRHVRFLWANREHKSLIIPLQECPQVAILLISRPLLFEGL